MKRKRPLESEVPQEAVKTKRQKSQVKVSETYSDTVGSDSQDKRKDLASKTSKKKAPKSQVTISDTCNLEKPGSNKMSKAKSDISENGFAMKYIPTSCEPPKGRGIDLKVRASSYSPSDFQPLGDYVKKAKNSKKNAATTQENSKKKKFLKKVTFTNRDDQNADLSEPESSTNGKMKTKNTSNVESTKNGTDTKLKHASANAGGKKAKKKVRIDETESLKVKKEMAEAETHFSAKELPAKIIKSKLNKNLTEEVKVSPLTIQGIKKEKKLLKKNEAGNKHNNGEDNSVLSTEIKTEDDLYPETGFPSGMEIDTTSEDSDLEVYYINKNAEKEAKRKSVDNKQTIKMPKEDQLILAERMQNFIPDDDTKSYKYRLRNLEWGKIAFKNYTLEECQKVWAQLLKKVRHYRLLVEITHDIKRVIERVDMEELKPRRSKSSHLHPDMPKRPLTSYFLYYIRKRDKLVKERPDLDTTELNRFISETYQNLPADKKQKYEVLAAKNRKEYNKQLEEFYSKHPEMRKVVIKKQRKNGKEKPPKRPENPYRLFIKEEQNREEILEEDKAEFKEVCREKWNQMSDEKKLVWINLAEERHMQYETEMKDFMARHPEYTPKSRSRKSVLSRQEVMLKDKLAGKPKKPPGTAYGLFISTTLQNGEIATIPPKERWNYTSAKWKAMTDEEREHYKVLLAQVHAQYQKDFKLYLDSLPEDKQQEEFLKNLPKKRKRAAADKVSSRGAKRKTTAAKSPSSRPKTTKQKGNPVQNPVPPARSAYKFFAEKFEGDNPKEAWKNLTSEEKDNYEQQLSVIKDKYIKDFEAYLKSLSKDELATFCANRGSQEEYSSSEDSESDSEHGEEESSDNRSAGSDSDNESE